MTKQLYILKVECEKNKTTQEEEQLYEQFVYQLVISEQTVQHCDELLKAHPGDSDHELVKALHAHTVDISAYHNGSIVGNHCMHMGANGDKIMDAITKGMKPKIRHANTKTYLNNICVQMKKISTCGTKL